jgi:hypothetical protein
MKLAMWLDNRHDHRMIARRKGCDHPKFSKSLPEAL